MSHPILLRSTPVPLTIFHAQVYAGFPSPAADYAQSRIDLNDHLLLNENASFLFHVRGDSMIDAHIVNGDSVILEIREPRPRDIVAALIDGETTLKRYILRNGVPYLKAENPEYPDLIPVQELVIQGVMVALIRKGGHGA